jgi:hypothetical protein
MIRGAEGEKIAPGKTTRGILIKVVLTIKPYPMKKPKLRRNRRNPWIGGMVINTLGTYFSKTLVKHLKMR